MALRALPFCMTLLLLPLLLAGMAWGGAWNSGGIIFAFLAAPALDVLTPLDDRNINPETDEAALFWHSLLTWIRVPLQLGLILTLLLVAGQSERFSRPEIRAMALTLGLATGGVGITNAQRNARVALSGPPRRPETVPSCGV